jgi:hypothetical protein
MAKTTSKSTTAATDVASEIDIKKFLPEGFDLSDFESVGGLRPICPPELNGETPVIGIPYALLDMPPRKSDKSAWQGILVHLLSTAQAQAGDEIVTVEKGKDIIIPVSGSLKANGDLLAAVVNTHKVTPAIFHVTGQMEVGKPSPMWVYDVKLAFKKQVPREGAFALYHRSAPVLTPAETVQRGEVLNANGQPVGRLVG